MNDALCDSISNLPLHGGGKLHAWPLGKYCNPSLTVGARTQKVFLMEDL